eukprot:6185665-Pleurochrysis_carterae.AAC.1
MHQLEKQKPAPQRRREAVTKSNHDYRMSTSTYNTKEIVRHSRKSECSASGKKMWHPLSLTTLRGSKRTESIPNVSVQRSVARSPRHFKQPVVAYAAGYRHT